MGSDMSDIYEERFWHIMPPAHIPYRKAHPHLPFWPQEHQRPYH